MGSLEGPKLVASILFALLILEASGFVIPRAWDTDEDRMPDWVEVIVGTDPEKMDTDMDGLMDGSERSFGTDPLNPDTDGDGIADGVEVLEGGDPLVPSPLLAIVLKERDLERFYDELSVLEVDGLLDQAEESLVEYVLSCLHGGLVPEGSEKYYDERIVRTLVENVVASSLEDRAVSREEAEALTALTKLPPDLQQDVILSGMLSDRALREDWDGDGFSNLEEVTGGFNPLNPLEHPGTGRSVRYFVLIQGAGLHGGNLLFLYHMIRMLGVPDDRILLYISPLSLSDELGRDSTMLMRENLARRWAGPFRVGQYMSDEEYGDRAAGRESLGPVQIDGLIGAELSVEDILRGIRGLRVDGDDLLVVVVDAHHLKGEEGFRLAEGEFLSVRDLLEAVRDLAPGRAVVVLNGCMPEGLLSDLPELNETLILLTAGDGEIIDGEYTRIFESLVFAPLYPKFYGAFARKPATAAGALEFFARSLRAEGYPGYSPSMLCLGCSKQWGEENFVRWTRFHSPRSSRQPP